MDFRLSVARYGQITKQRNALVGLLAIAFSMNILQMIERMNHSEKIILVPPDLKQTVWLQKKNVSDSLVEEWALFMSQLLLTVSPQTISFQRDLALRHVDPGSFARIKQQFDQDKVRLEKDHAATTFMPSQIEVHLEKRQACITGLLSTYVGRERVSEHQQKFLMTFDLKDWGHLQLCSFEKDNQTEKGGL